MGNYVENYDLIVKKWEPVLVTPAEETKRGIYFLSNVDEDENLVRTIYCYHHKKTNGGQEAGEVIKNALSKALVHYYPLAGRLILSPEGGFAVNCTGEGVVFIEAEADCGLDDVDFSKPDKATRGKLAAFDAPDGMGNKFEIPLMAQVTKFKCGGFVLGISFNHVLADGQAAAEFIVSWAETARGLPISVPPFLDRTILKARTPPKIEFHHSEFDPIEDKSSAVNDFSNEEIMVYKYLKFTPQMIQTAKSKTTGLLTKPCSSYEALSAFVWRARTRALNTAPDQLTRILLVVNTRGRFEPPLPKGYFGNAIKYTAATCQARDLVDQPLSYVVGLVQEAIRRVNDEHLRSTIDYNEIRRAIRPLGFTYISSTWSGLAFGSTNFGWGEAISTGPVELPVDEGILFLPRQEKGKMCMYAFMGLPVSAMGNFEELVRQIN
ncbi:unnamed protein product [Linum tenue]|uniref:Uncharacterized protein n=1 Tax=Linum tenue TaxID=586396 RepID=A0AAV0NGR9_9ROSI|nr:unnamed protein product [Linum tenue]